MAGYRIETHRKIPSMFLTKPTGRIKMKLQIILAVRIQFLLSLGLTWTVWGKILAWVPTC